MDEIWNFQRQKQFLYFTIVLGVLFTAANYMMVHRAATGAYVIDVNLRKESETVDQGESIQSVRHKRSMESRPNITSVLEMLMKEKQRVFGNKNLEMEEIKASFPTKSSSGIRQLDYQNLQGKETDETFFENQPKLTTIYATTKYVPTNSNQSPLNDIEAERKGQRLLIVAYFRSGSTFTADIFKNYSDVFYVFEPFHALDYSIKRNTPIFYLNGSSRLNHAANMTNMNFLHNEAKKWIYCRFDELDTSSLTDALTWRLGSEIGKKFLLCNGVKSLMPLAVNPNSSHRKCNNLVRESCLESKLRLFKFIRLPMTVAGRLLTGDSNLKVIHLLRDPRGMLVSQRRKEHKIEWPIRYCETMLSDLKASVQLQNIFPGRVTILRYEDLAENPVSIASKLYKFIGIQMPKVVEEYIKEKTSGGKEKKCMLCTQKANSSETASKWRTKIDLRYMKLIDHVCEKLYEAAGYLEFKSRADLLNLSLPSKDERDYILK
ncbi:hypothetical protein CHS0354_030968 [Potamilus streckersoni]|uniref:Sulfotransferase domain-containing protein n=1 Tax=Potamilus streckersoni TaxID=2493646 RepID=A0AAE0SFH4_9BIVA|nr:hypothetical protein CHS0354_030968 [Potamilus streckersoni]